MVFLMSYRHTGKPSLARKETDAASARPQAPSQPDDKNLGVCSQCCFLSLDTFKPQLLLTG